MKALKTYFDINASDENAGFAISKMEAIYEKTQGMPDVPHRHDYYTILVVKKGSGVHKIDFNTYPIANQQVFFVAPGQVHQVIEEKASIGFVMTFSDQFLIENGIPITFIESLNLFQDYGESPPLLPNSNQFEKILNSTFQIFQTFYENPKMKDLIIGAYLKLFLIECNNVCSINPIEFSSDISENKIVRAFKDLVNHWYKSQHATTFYANKLHITPDHLNRVIKTIIGKTAKEYIQSRISTEAKRLLYFSNLSQKEIGYALGFNEPANFSAFFKKCTGSSPSKFLKDQQIGM